MINPLAIANDLALAVKAATTLQNALPLLNKTVNDVRTAYESRSDATKEYAALEAVIEDINTAIAGLSALFPPANTEKVV